MDTSQLIVALVGMAASVVFVVQSFRRLLSKRQDWLLAKTDTTYPDQAFEIRLTNDLYTGQRLRFTAYLAILLIFLSLVLSEVLHFEIARLVRSVLSLFTLIAFAVEETFLDRAKVKLLADIKAARESRNGL